MTISMSQSLAMINGAFDFASAQGYAPMQAIVVDIGGNVLAFLKQDGSSIMRFEQCHGKACAALSVAPGHSRRLRDIATDDPAQFAFLSRVSPHLLSPVGGGYRVLDARGRVLGAMAVAGDTSGNDEAAARAGIAAAGFSIAEEIGIVMTITLDHADRIIDSILKVAAGRGPVAVVVTDAGGSPKAFKKQDGGFLLDFEIAAGRAFAALSLSPGTSAQLAAFRDRSPGFRVLVESVVASADGRMVVEAGGVRISDAGQNVIGAVGVAGLSPEECQSLAIDGVKAAGFRAP